MSKRLLTLITLVLLLAAVSVTQAQDGGLASAHPGVTLTAAQIKADFRIPSTPTRQISNLDVDVQGDSLHVSFRMVVRDGTSNTSMNIIAILIGLNSQPRVESLALENTMVSGWVVPPGMRDEVSSLLVSSWNNYTATVLVQPPAGQTTAEGIIMRDGGICDPIRHMGC